MDFKRLLILYCSSTALISAFPARAGQAILFRQGTIQTGDSIQSIGQSKEQYKLPHVFTANEAQKEMLIQFQSRIHTKDRQVLQDLGAELLRYLPEDTLVVRGSATTLTRISGLANVQSMLAYPSWAKLSNEFVSVRAQRTDLPQRILITLFPGTPAMGVVSKISALGRVIYQDGSVIVMDSVMGKMSELSEQNGIEHIQIYPQMTTMNFSADRDPRLEEPQGQGDYSDLNGSESGAIAMLALNAWTRGFTGAGQVGAFADTGLDSGVLSSLSSDFAQAVVAGHAVGLFGKSWEDPMGHGTHVAGSIAGKGIYSNGIIKGTGFGAQLSAIGMWSPMLNNLSVPSKLSTIFTAAIQDGASVESNSWGSPRNLGEYDSFANQVDEFTWKNSELLVLFAAGNSGVDADKDGRIDGNSISSPGTSKNALTVGASENVTTSGGIQVPISKLRSGKDNWGVEPIFSSYLSDNRDGIAMFSSRGPTADGRIKPDIVAPGTNILSARSHHKDASALWGAYNDNYVWSGGTSMATPLVAGAALVAREYLQKRLKLERPTAAALKAYLIHNADEMYPGQYGEGGASHGQEILTLRPNGDEGYGRVNMNKMTRDSQNILVVDQRTRSRVLAMDCASSSTNYREFGLQWLW